MERREGCELWTHRQEYPEKGGDRLAFQPRALAQTFGGYGSYQHQKLIISKAESYSQVVTSMLIYLEHTVTVTLDPDCQ